jgi:hypothetical protein
MSSKIGQLLESARTIDDRTKVMEGLISKWEKWGLLEGCDNNPHDKKQMALLLENQLKQVVKEAAIVTNNGGSTFTAGAGEQWAGIALPMARKVFGDITSKEFLSNQPMSIPYGLIFYLDFKYGANQPGSIPGTRFNQGDSIYGNTFTSTIQPNVNPLGGLYGAGRFGYSINEYSAVVATGSVTATTASFTDVNYNGIVSASVAAGNLRKITVASASVVLPNLDTTAVRSFVATGSGISEAVLLPEFTSYNSTFDTLAFVTSGSYTASPITVYYSYATKDNLRGDFESTDARPLTGSAEIPSIDIAPRSEYLATKTRKLKYSFTQEAQQDYVAFQGVDIEAESNTVLSEYISKEIDLELLEKVSQAGNNTVEVWSALNNRFFNKSTNAFEDRAAGATGYYNSQTEWFETLGTQIRKVSRMIHAKTQRGEATVLMTTPLVSAIIESIGGFASTSDGSKMEYTVGTKEVGKLHGQYKLIVNSYMQENTIVMAYKGSSLVDCGGVFAPYVPLVSTPLVYDPITFKMSKGLLTRYASKITLAQYFGKVLIADLDKI